MEKAKMKNIENIDQMRKRHKQEIEILQKNCRHEKLSDWIEEYWAIAHSTGNIVRVCKFCSKVIEKKAKYEYRIIDDIGRFIQI